VSSFAKSILVVSVLILLLVAAVFGIIVWREKNENSLEVAASFSTNGMRRDSVSALRQIEAEEEQANQTFWAKELLAEECGRTFEGLWDQINRATNKLSLLASFPVEEVVLGKWDALKTLPHGIEIREAGGKGTRLSGAEWRSVVNALQQAGWNLETIEFRQNQFDVDESGKPKSSRFYFSAHILNAVHEERAIIEGDLIVQWGTKKPDEEIFPVRSVDASGLTIKTRAGALPFKEILNEEITPTGRSSVIDPLIVYDLDGDGYPEIILAAKNVVFRRRGEDHYESEPLCRVAPEFVSSAIIADFDGDGSADFLYHRYEGLYLYKGSSKGTFDETPRLVWPGTPNVQNSIVLTCGDIDHDGGLDLFLAQYREPYEGGATPQPFYDANDGYPSYLLLNDGHGNFTDATAAAGLTKKRFRRSYSASFVDLNQDGNLDLVVVSDFAGLDIYRNDGRGHFTDVTQAWVRESHAFGMAHTFADFNGDGWLDLLMIGMISPTVERLEHLGLWRSDFPEDRSMRSRMTYGNRLYLAKAGGGFEQTSLSDAIARSGWSWGASAFDFDNDGFPDVYIANGLESNASVRDYESEYWLHDRFVGAVTNNTATDMYFKSKFSRTRGRDYSYGGYEKNRLYLNQGGNSFVEVAYLMGVAIEEDCRNVVATDLDGDGRVDLVVTTLEISPKRKQTLRIYKNALEDAGNWIGFRLSEGGKGKSAVGASVTLDCGGKKMIRQIVTGDSYRSQHPSTVHFGLGSATQVESADIRWANGESLTLRRPELSEYHQP
jgi:hypothetical protein